MSTVDHAYSSGQGNAESPTMTALVIVSDDEEFRNGLLGELDKDGDAISYPDFERKSLSLPRARAEILMLDCLVNNIQSSETPATRDSRSGAVDRSRGPSISDDLRSRNLGECASVGELVDHLVDNWRSTENLSFSVLRKIRGEIGGSVDSASLVREFDLLKLDYRSQRAYWKGDRVSLTATEFAFVNLLASRSGIDVPYRDLYDLVHGKDFVAGYGSKGFRVNVRAMVKRIRQKFRAIDPSFCEIQNSPCVGYRWSALSRAATTRTT